MRVRNQGGKSKVKKYIYYPVRVLCVSSIVRIEVSSLMLALSVLVLLASLP